MIYSYPKFSELDFYKFRFLGPGLGNLLFPWARCLVESKKNAFQVLSPTWPQLKLGPYLRNSSDKRSYHDLFVPLSSEITGFKRLCKLITLPRVDESDAVRDNVIVEYSGMNGYFGKIVDDNEVVKQALIDITRREHLSGFKSSFENSISLHIRMGDFAVATSADALRAGQHNVRIPLSWYAEQIKKLRASSNKLMKVYVFSDGTNDELQDILNLGETVRANFGSSIGDLLALSRANLMIASGSTFSMWASYLGRMPCIWHPGQLRQKLYKGGGIEVELEMQAELPTEIVKYLAGSNC